MDNLTPIQLGACLAHMRAQWGTARGEELSQRRLAQVLGIKPQAYNSWEQGKTLPRLDHLWALARYYGISLDQLCGYNCEADTTLGIAWTSVRRAATDEDAQAMELFHRALTGDLGEMAENRVSLALRHVFYSQLVRIRRAPRPDLAFGEALKKRFNTGGKKRLKEVRVIPFAPGVPDQLRALVVGVAAKEYFLEHLDGNPAIGLAPGYAVSCMVRSMYREDPIKPFSVYPLVALPVVDRPDIDANTLIGELIYKYADRGVRGLALQCPGFSPHNHSLEYNPTAREVLTRATCVDMAFVGIGSIEGPLPYFDRGIMNILDMTGISVESLKERGIVGDVCFHLLDAAGNPQEQRLSAGLSTVSLHTFQHLVSLGQQVVVLASNPLKALPIYSAIRGGDSGRGYVNVLIIDTQVAERLLAVTDAMQDDAALCLH